ncbi:S-adenosyl-L-methionine-dependent methyltransferase [Coemansia reversa NRRL 1564]|uniref:sphingolipid C(9)-methyltransferase n=1 Tax=Coemansia reversa (strain ATCC 12441 / NRRL 1564) TaxID=763665 RepID=A0A2G5B6Q0_COERN|nr:S-adenosyl-L-methionine-dependent methyltransferase [Coemansia reversa NRRL 1564]|eukprot:PIA14662.1 S-adenosyl-L-methionine-dependent methyltransferase [Coemansia reversa NRRL 1564]
MERVGREYLDLGPEDRLLDINAQWGDLAVYLAHDFQVPTCAIVATSSQLAHATNLTGESQVQRFLRFVTGDYRAVAKCLAPGIPPFTKAIALDVLDTIGTRNIPSFLRSVNESMVNGGRLLIQVTTTPGEEEWAEHWWYHWFRQNYIQPGADTSMLTSIEQIMVELQRAGFEVLQLESLTTDAALTTAIWSNRLCASKRQIETELGEDTYRAWELYLNWTQSLYARARLHKHFILAVKRA